MKGGDNCSPDFYSFVWNSKISCKFVGALAGQGAKKGVFITTSRFTNEAKEYQPKNETKIVLIDGEQLADLMIDFDLAVTTTHTFTIKRIDNNYFEEE
jgi:restriction system protein